jgi:hypothetical protein
MRHARIPRLVRNTVATQHAAPQAARTFATTGPNAGHDLSRIQVLSPRLQRWSFGSGAPPHPDYTVVAKDHRKRVEDAMGLVERVAQDPKTYPVCQKYFKSECPGGTNSTFSDRVNAATIWHDSDKTVWASTVRPSNMGFGETTWRFGRWTLAGEFVHELMHQCGQDNETSNDAAMKKCGFPDIEDFLHKGK